MSTMTEDRKKELLAQFNSLPELKEAVRDEILKGIYSNGVIKEGEAHDPAKNWALHTLWNADERSNEQIGAILRAQAEALQFIIAAFDKIGDYKMVEAKDSGDTNTNPGR